jgi:hypothetical protein
LIREAAQIATFRHYIVNGAFRRSTLRYQLLLGGRTSPFNCFHGRHANPLGGVPGGRVSRAVVPERRHDRPAHLLSIESQGLDWSLTVEEWIN